MVIEVPKVRALTESGREAQRKKDAMAALGRQIMSQAILAGYPHKKALAERLHIPYSTLHGRIVDPGTMRLSELYDIMQLPGVERDQLLKALT